MPYRRPDSSGWSFSWARASLAVASRFSAWTGLSTRPSGSGSSGRGGGGAKPQNTRAHSGPKTLITRAPLAEHTADHLPAPDLDDEIAIVLSLQLFQPVLQCRLGLELRRGEQHVPVHRERASRLLSTRLRRLRVGVLRHGKSNVVRCQDFIAAHLVDAVRVGGLALQDVEPYCFWPRRP